MAIRTKSQALKDSEDNDVVVETTTFAGSYGVELFGKVFLLSIPFILQTVKSDKDKTLLESDIDIDRLSSSLTQKMTDKSIVKVVLELTQTTIVKINDTSYDLSKKQIFDIVFSGEYSLLVKVLKFILEVNFSSFFAENGINELIEMIPAMLK